MKVIDLVKTCANNGCGEIKVVNSYNHEDNATFSDLSKLEKINSICNHEVKYWEFVPKEQLSNRCWEFVLEILI